MAIDTEYQFHAQRLMENPAWRRLFDDARRDLDHDRDRLELSDRDGRWAITVAETMLTKLERRAALLAETGKIEQFHAERMGKVA